MSELNRISELTIKERTKLRDDIALKVYLATDKSIKGSYLTADAFLSERLEGKEIAKCNCGAKSTDSKVKKLNPPTPTKARIVNDAIYPVSGKSKLNGTHLAGGVIVAVGVITILVGAYKGLSYIWSSWF